MIFHTFLCPEISKREENALENKGKLGEEGDITSAMTIKVFTWPVKQSLLKKK